MNEEEAKILSEHKKYLSKICIIKNSISLICFTILAIVFNKWWIVFFSALFTSYVGKSES